MEMLKELTRKHYQVFLPDGSSVKVNGELQSSKQACEFLEAGGIIYFPESPFKRSSEDTEFLLHQNQKDASYHKNIAYRPQEDRITGAKNYSQQDMDRLRSILREFTKQSEELVDTLLSPYAGNYSKDFASYRPIEEKGRQLRLRARNDLIHVDSFPTRPTMGDRILRVFENVNPDQGRIWRTSETFEVLARQFRQQRPAPANLDKPGRTLLPTFLMKALGLKLSSGSAYDSWMNAFHNFLKENQHFQNSCKKNIWDFPPGSTWIVYTDMVSHSVLSGQFALEQTFIISQRHMVLPDKAPINVLRQLYS